MYFQKKMCVAMILAGGQGSRLTVLTEKTATFNHVNGTVDFAPTSRINLETPEY